MNELAAVSKILIELKPEVDFDASIDFIQDGVLDSFDIILLVAEIEKNFSVKIPGEKITAENFKSAASICEMLTEC